jgi:hypothetical protein
MKIPITCALLALALSAAAGTKRPPSTVTRAEVMATAERYRTLAWVPTKANIRHGTDRAGIRIDTPDAAFRPGGTFPGWWRTGMVNKSMPYKWGGFDTPESFLTGLSTGLAAGDICTAEKRQLLDAAVSREALGIDCSGFISRCWNLPRAYSTRTLFDICDPIDNFDDLKPGDIFNGRNSHVFLFARWIDPERKRMMVYTAGTKPLWGVQIGPVRAQQMRDLRYVALRYRGIRD